MTIQRCPLSPKMNVSPSCIATELPRRQQIIEEAQFFVGLFDPSNFFFGLVRKAQNHARIDGSRTVAWIAPFWAILVKPPRNTASNRINGYTRFFQDFLFSF